MKRLSISLPAITLVLVLALSGSAFTSATSTADTKDNRIAKLPYSNLHVPFVKETFQYDYYWFWYPDDTFNDQETLTMEEWEMGEFYYPGVEIDANPMGGTLIMEGYLAPNQPHVAYASIYLYVHYTQ